MHPKFRFRKRNNIKRNQHQYRYLWEKTSKILDWSCNAENKSLVNSLKSKIDKFPEGEFNHFFQFSLAVIALYLHDEEIPSVYGEKIIQNVFTSKKKINVHGNSTISDTKALSLLALSALLSQPSTTLSIRNQSLEIMKNAETEIHNLLIKNNEDNLITLSLIVQVRF